MAYQKITIGGKKEVLTLDEIHLKKENREKINQLIEEFTYIEAFKKFKIPVDNKILLHGHTGCGKTATANAIAKALNKKIITLNLGGFVSSKLGETGKNLSDVFKTTSYDNAVLFIDEFDFVGKLRDYDNQDSGEMKRLVNTLIQQIDNLNDDSLLICATNHIKVIDTALLRRFQIKLEYELPDKEKLDKYYDSILVNFPENINKIKRTYEISYAEAKDLIYQQIKVNIIKLEKEKKHFLFLYETLKKQNSNGSKDTLFNYQLNELENKTEKSEPYQLIAKKTKNENDKIEGIIVELSGEELRKFDKEKAVDYKRILEKFESGKQAWIYVSKNSF